MRIIGRIAGVAAVAYATGFLPIQGAELRCSANEAAQDKNADKTGGDAGELTGRFTVRGKLPPPRFVGPVMPRTGKRITDNSIKTSGKEQGLANAGPSTGRATHQRDWLE
jgi:hypothetical protein